MAINSKALIQRTKVWRVALTIFGLVGAFVADAMEDSDIWFLIGGSMFALGIFGNFLIGPLLFFHPAVVRRTVFILQLSVMSIGILAWGSLFFLFESDYLLPLVLIIVSSAIAFHLIQNFEQGRRKKHWKIFPLKVQAAGWKVEAQNKPNTKHLHQIFRLHEFSKIEEQVFSKPLASGFVAHLVCQQFIDTTDDKSLIVGTLTYVSARLPGKIDGWMIVFPEAKTFVKYFVDLDLESVGFNRKVYAHAEPPNLVPLVLHPDTMEWFVQLPVHPWFHIEKDSVALGLGQDPTLVEIDRLTDILDQFLPKLQRSGALE